MALIRGEFWILAVGLGAAPDQGVSGAGGGRDDEKMPLTTGPGGLGQTGRVSRRAYQCPCAGAITSPANHSSRSSARFRSLPRMSKMMWDTPTAA